MQLPTRKRVLDLTVAISALLLVSPVMFLVGISIYVVMGRPILFRQMRPGREGIPFTMYKFRTMEDAFGDAGHPLSNEVRLTRLGRFLRAVSLDELPELWNVVKGEMSLVGPRPLLMDYLDLYTPEQMRRHAVQPGITGWAQIHGRNNASWEERFKMDLWYVDNRSTRLDLRILVMTVRKVLSREGISVPGRSTIEKFKGTPRT